MNFGITIFWSCMYIFWSNFGMYQQSSKLYYMDTDSFITHIKTADVYKDTAGDVERDLMHQFMKSIGHYLQEKTDKVLD